MEKNDNFFKKIQNNIQYIIKIKSFKLQKILNKNIIEQIMLKHEKRIFDEIRIINFRSIQPTLKVIEYSYFFWL